MNVYEMFYKNNFLLGFWVRRDNWKNVKAKIILIDGFEEGKRPKGCGRYPYFNYKADENKEGPRQVLAEFYNASTNELMSRDCISCPGNYSYYMIEQPVINAEPKVKIINNPFL